MRRNFVRRPVGGALLWFAAVAACDSSEQRTDAIDSVRMPLTAECHEGAEAALPEGAWLCPEPRRMECAMNRDDAPDEVIFVQPPGAETCNDIDPSVEPGPFPVGAREIVVTDMATDRATREICRSELTVVDTTPPLVDHHDVSLWPPNHKMHAVSIQDCVTALDACDPRPSARFVWATSDEPADARGDGDTEADVQFSSCTEVAIRSERSGTGDGRVYSLGWVVTDAAGNSVESVCRVTVPHDQGGHPAVASAMAYELSAPPCGP